MSCQNAFSSDEPIDYVFNCAGETKSGLTDPVYKEGIYKLSLNCAQQAAKIGASHYVEISSGNLSTSEKVSLRMAYILTLIWTFDHCAMLHRSLTRRTMLENHGRSFLNINYKWNMN